MVVKVRTARDRSLAVGDNVNGLQGSELPVRNGSDRMCPALRPSRGAVTIPSTSSHTVGEEARQLFRGRDPEIDRQWHRNPGKVEGVVTETVDVLSVVGTQPRQGRPIGG